VRSAIHSGGVELADLCCKFSSRVIRPCRNEFVSLVQRVGQQPPGMKGFIIPRRESHTIPAPFRLAEWAKTKIQQQGQRAAWLYKFPTDLELRAFLADQPRRGVQLEFLEYLYRHKASNRKREFNDLLSRTCECDPLRPGYVRLKPTPSSDIFGSLNHLQNILHGDKFPQ
jgi:hypothetical protein